jgi:signal transduction histidine kinase
MLLTTWPAFVPVLGQEAELPLLRLAELQARAIAHTTTEIKARTRGVVTLTLASHQSFVMQDGDTGMYAFFADAQTARSHAQAGLVPGVEVEVEGTVQAGRLAPTFRAFAVRVLGPAPLPPARPATWADLQSGRADCLRVTVQGVVQSVELGTDPGQATHALALPDGRAVATLPLLAERGPEQLVDAAVRVSGVCLAIFNRRSELLGMNVRSNLAGDLVVDKAAPADPFAGPLAPLDRLQPYSPGGFSLHRQRIAGVVTFAQPGIGYYVQAGRRAVRVRTSRRAALAPGDEVNVAGFTEMVGTRLELRDAVFLKTGVAPVPEPVEVTPAEVLARWHPAMDSARTDFDGRLVSLRGRLEKITAAVEGDGARLYLDCAGQVISAALDDPGGTAALRLGSELRVTGICLVSYPDGDPARGFPQPQSFSLVLRGGADVAVLRAASWWTSRRLGYALGWLGAGLVLALLWVVALRRRVAVQASRLALEMRARRDAALEHDATLRERTRLAADLHDTLEQALTGVAFRVEAIVVSRAKGQDTPETLDQVRRLLASVREDVRRSVWNLRATALEGHTLPEALTILAERSGAGSAVLLTVETDGPARELPEFVAGNLLLLAQEAMTNALKHAAPRRIAVRVAFTDKAVTLAVSDDGRGFDPARSVGPEAGHFGLQGMRERVKRLGGTLEITSIPGGGTRLVATVPVHALDADVAA